MRVRVCESHPDPLVSSSLSRRNAFATCMQQLWMPGKLFSTNLQCSVSVPNATTSVVGHASPEGCIALLGILVQSAAGHRCGGNTHPAANSSRRPPSRRVRSAAQFSRKQSELSWPSFSFSARKSSSLIKDYVHDTPWTGLGPQSFRKSDLSDNGNRCHRRWRWRWRWRWRQRQRRRWRWRWQRWRWRWRSAVLLENRSPKHEHSLTVTIAVIHDVHVLLLLPMVPLYFISFYFVSNLFHLTTSGDPRADEKTRAPSHALAPCALP